MTMWVCSTVGTVSGEHGVLCVSRHEHRIVAAFPESFVENSDGSFYDPKEKLLYLLQEVKFMSHPVLDRYPVDWPIDIISVREQLEGAGQPWLFSDGYQWSDKPHRIFRRAFDEILEYRRIFDAKGSLDIARMGEEIFIYCTLPRSENDNVILEAMKEIEEYRERLGLPLTPPEE